MQETWRNKGHPGVRPWIENVLVLKLTDIGAGLIVDKNGTPHFYKTEGNSRFEINDPDSYKFLDATAPVRDTRNGVPCFVVVVHFLAKNAFNATVRGYAYVYVVSNGRGGWTAIDREINA
jgi:hypothetical protein